MTGPPSYAQLVLCVSHPSQYDIDIFNIPGSSVVSQSYRLFSQYAIEGSALPTND